jgi:hypothetical protein
LRAFTLGMPATGVSPTLVSTLRNTPHTNAPSGLEGATGVFNPKAESTPASSVTTGFGAGAAAAAGVTGVVIAAGAGVTGVVIAAAAATAGVVTAAAAGVAGVVTAAAAGVAGVVIAVAAITGFAGVATVGVVELTTVEPGRALALLPVDPVAPVELVVVASSGALVPAASPVVAEVSWLSVLSALPGTERVLPVERPLGPELAVVATPVELVAPVPEVVESALPVTPSSAVRPPLPVLVDVEGLLALSVGALVVALDALVVAGRLPPVGDTVFARDV